MISGLLFSDFRTNTHGSKLIFIKPKPSVLTEYSQKITKCSRAASMHPYIPPVSYAHALSYYFLLMKQSSTIYFGKLMYTFVFNLRSRKDAST